MVAMAADAFAHGRRGGSGGRGWSGHHRHFHGGAAVFIGAPLFIPRYYAPYYYPAPVYSAPPPVYVEQPQQGYWHYCPQSNAYYPQVQTCPGGWQLVPPQPSTGN